MPRPLLSETTGISQNGVRMLIHTVTPGETLFSIASDYNLTVSYLERINELPNPEALVVGQDIVIAYTDTIHTVSEWDTLTSLSERYGIPLLTILRNNPAIAARTQAADGSIPLFPGESIIIRYSDQTASVRNPISVIGYAYPNIDRAILQQTLPFLTYLSIFTYGFTFEGELITVDDSELIAIARSYGTAPILLFSTLGPDGQFNNNLSSALFASPELQERIISTLIQTMQEKGYYGLDIDFEFVLPEEREAYIAFVTLLTERCNAAGFEVLVALAPKTSSTQRGLLYESHDYGGLAAAANTVLLMTYEWGYTYGPPLAVAPIPNVRRVLDYAITEIPPEIIFMGIPNYGYDWPLPYERGVTRARSLGNVEAVEIASRYGATISFDPESQAPFFYYTDENGAPHVVWFENARSIEAKLNLIVEYGFLGAGYWNVMRWFPQNWLVMNLQFEIRTLLPVNVR